MKHPSVMESITLIIVIAAILVLAMITSCSESITGTKTTKVPFVEWKHLDDSDTITIREVTAEPCIDST